MVGSPQRSGMGSRQAQGPDHAGWRGWVPAESIAEGAGVGGGGKHRKNSRAAGRCSPRFIKIVCHRNGIRLTPSALLLLTTPQAPSPLPPICTQGSSAPVSARNRTSACSKARSSHLA